MLSKSVKFLLAVLLISFAQVSYAGSPTTWIEFTQEIQDSMAVLKNPALNNLQRKTKLQNDKEEFGELFQKLLKANTRGTEITDAAYFTAFDALSTFVVLSNLEIQENGKATLESCDRNRSTLTALNLTADDISQAPSALANEAQEILNLICK